MKYISDVMTRDVITVDIQESIYEVAKIMRDYVIGFAPVVSDGQLVGVITDRDLVIRGYAERKSDRAPISDVMTSHCVIVDSDATIEETARAMSEHKIRRVCVVDKDQVVGICAIGDLAVDNQSGNEAGEALSRISTPTRQQISLQ